MDTSRIESVIMEEVKEVIESRMHDVRFTLKAALRRLYWPGYLDRSIPEAALLKLDDLVDVAFNTTRRCGPEDESYPCLDEKKARVIQDELQALLKLPTEKER